MIMSTDTQKNTQVLRDWVDTMNKGDYAQVKKALEKLGTEDYCLHDPNPANCAQGLKNYIVDFDKWWRGISDLHVVVEDVFGAGDKTATRATIEYIENNTREKKKNEIIFISRFENGKIAEEWQVTAPVG
jgi:predicted SnoaL-like aldol condensation-catalyzing enzyme